MPAGRDDCSQAKTGKVWTRSILGDLVSFGPRALENFEQEALTYLVKQFSRREKEVLVQVLFDSKGNYLADQHFRLDQRDFLIGRYHHLFQGAWEARADGFVLLHNHPSGNPTPSPADVTMTRNVAALCRALDVSLIDHFVVGARSIVSMRRAGLL